MFSVFTNDRSAKLELGRQLCKNATEIWIGYYHACVLQHRGVNWVLYCDSWHWNGKVIFNHEKFKTLKRSPIVRINSWEGLEVIATSVNPHKITKSFLKNLTSNSLIAKSNNANNTFTLNDQNLLASCVHQYPLHQRKHKSLVVLVDVLVVWDSGIQKKIVLHYYLLKSQDPTNFRIWYFFAAFQCLNCKNICLLSLNVPVEVTGVHQNNA